jgi:ubiquinone/menaquinone biosynthesis C-methylase UbiE
MGNPLMENGLTMEPEPQHIHFPRDTDATAVSEPQVLPTREGYDLWAHSYDEEDNPLIALETTLVRRLLGDVRGLTVADIGCGTGRHAIAMAEAGAKVIAVDFSMGMLAKARAKPGAAAVRFVHHDLTWGLPLASRTFDRVTCCLVLEHIVDLESVLGEMARICQPDGFVLISDLHPAMRLRGIQAQFADPATGQKIRPASVAHQLSDYVMAATRAGLRIDHMSEHVVDQGLLERSPRARKYWEDHRDYLGWPFLLLIRLRHGEKTGRVRQRGESSHAG